MATPTVPMTSLTEASSDATSEHRSTSRYGPSPPASIVSSLDDHRLETPALILLQLALGAVLLWAFFDKLFGLGYVISALALMVVAALATPAVRALRRLVARPLHVAPEGASA